jgi:acyl-CoA synthetase (AMP-forming)/AMP-acid ligase II
MADQRINSVFMVPTMIRRILEQPIEVLKQHEPTELRALISGAAPFDDALRLRAIERFGASAVFDFYGATELGWVTLVDGREMLERPGSLGRAIVGQEIAIMDEEGRRLPPGEIGRVYTRSAQVMSGYLRDDEATERTRRGPWLTVDDLGFLDEDGYLFLTGRDRDMVITGGVNVYPVEVENALAHHPDVRELAVIGIPDDQWGECLTAVYVGDVTIDPEAARTWASKRLSAYKIPRRWERVDELPRNPTGKILKRDLVQRFS